MLYREQTFAPRAFHSELEQQTNTVNTQKIPALSLRAWDAQKLAQNVFPPWRGELAPQLPLGFRSLRTRAFLARVNSLSPVLPSLDVTDRRGTARSLASNQGIVSRLHLWGMGSYYTVASYFFKCVKTIATFVNYTCLSFIKLIPGYLVSPLRARLQNSRFSSQNRFSVAYWK